MRVVIEDIVPTAPVVTQLPGVPDHLQYAYPSEQSMSITIRARATGHSMSKRGILLGLIECLKAEGGAE